MSRPRALVLQAPGTNRDHDAVFALELAGADARIASLLDLADDDSPLLDVQLLVVAGGYPQPGPERGGSRAAEPGFVAAGSGPGRQSLGRRADGQVRTETRG